MIAGRSDWVFAVAWKDEEVGCCYVFFELGLENWSDSCRFAGHKVAQVSKTLEMKSKFEKAFATEPFRDAQFVRENIGLGIFLGELRMYMERARSPSNKLTWSSSTVANLRWNFNIYATGVGR